MPPDRPSALFPVAEKIVHLVIELYNGRLVPTDARKRQIDRQLRDLLLDYEHGEVLWMLAQPEPPKAPPAAKSKSARRYKSHPWYGFGKRPKGAP